MIPGFLDGVSLDKIVEIGAASGLTGMAIGFVAGKLDDILYHVTENKYGKAMMQGLEAIAAAVKDGKIDDTEAAALMSGLHKVFKQNVES